VKHLTWLITGFFAGLYLTMPILSVVEALVMGRNPWKARR
jgi:hypothetical protein